MGCEWKELVLLAELDELSVSEAREARLHLQACNECQSALKGYQALINQSQKLAVPEPTQATWQRIELNLWDRIEASKQNSWRQRLIRWIFPQDLGFQPSWVLAGLVAFLFLPPMLDFNLNSSAKPVSTTTAAEEVLNQMEHLPDYVPMDTAASEKSAGSISAVSSEAILAYLDDYAQVSHGEVLNRDEAAANNSGGIK